MIFWPEYEYDKAVMGLIEQIIICYAHSFILNIQSAHSGHRNS